MSPDNHKRRCCSFFTFSLKEKCFFIGYINLLAAIVDLALHLFVLGVSTNGFQCDMDNYRLNVMDIPWVGSLFCMLNLGTHGFYNFPVVFGSEHGPLDYSPSEIRCYPGMLHVYLIDVLHVMINVIWLRFALSYVKALHQSNTEPMRIFFNIYLLKWIIQIIYVSFTPHTIVPGLANSFWFIRALDFFIAFVFMCLIRKYTLMLRIASVVEANNPDHPPSYFECIVSSLSHHSNLKKEKEDEKKEADIVIPVENKTEVTTGQDVPKTVV